MSREFGKTLGHAGVYTVGVILSRAISFIMLPVYTRYLSPADYGVLELLEVTVDVISIVAGIGVLNGFSRFYYQCRTDDEKKELVSTIFILVGSFYFVACLMGALASRVLSNAVFGTGQYSLYVLIAFVNLFFMILLHTNTYYLRTRQKSVTFVVVSSVDLLCKLSLNILFVIHLGMGVLGILVSSLISVGTISIAMTVYVSRRIGIRFSRARAVELMKFGAPFVLSGLCAFINTYADRFFLKHYTDLASVGIYSLAYKFGFLLMMFPVTPMMNIWMVQRFELVEKDGYERVFNQFLTWFSIITLTVALFVAMIVRDVLRIMSAPAFWEAYRIVPVIVLAYFFQAATDFFNFGIYHSGKTKHVAYGTLLAAVATILLSFVLIPRYGTYGAAWATLVAFAVRMVYYYVASQKLFRVRYDLAKPVFCTVLSIGVYLVYVGGVAAFPFFQKTYVNALLSLTLLSVFGAMLFVLGIISPDERRALFQYIRFPSKALRELKA